MAVTNYHTLNGTIRGQTSAGVRTDYLTDALGSVTATVDQTGAVQNTYRHKPYGDLLAKTGAYADPSFLWVGTQGYRATGLKTSSHYVRARHYDAVTGTWTTVDPRWPGEPQYGYVGAAPTQHADRSGNGPEYVGGSFNVSYSGCGQINWRSLWTLKGKPEVGMVIQRLAFWWCCSTCQGAPCPGWPSSCRQGHYIEGWPVYESNGNWDWHDEYGNTDFFHTADSGSCTSGFLWVQGRVAFYRGYEYPGRPTWIPGATTYAGGLPVADEKLLSFAPIGGPPKQTHDLVMTWDCCHRPSGFMWRAALDKDVKHDDRLPGDRDPHCYPTC